MSSELEENLLRETIDIFSRAVATGVSDAVNDGDDMPRDEFLYQLKHNVEVFSAFRTHRMQNDIAAQLTDDEGKLRTFSQFRKAVEGYTDHKNRAWLRTEYDTAIRRAHQAADWQQFEAEKDVLPNLEWIPSTSPTPGADHRVFWGTVLPVDDPFWKEHRPGDRWNCKCELRATDKDCTARPHGTEKDNPQSGLENNPGKDGHLFSDKHPYYPDSCASCPYSGNKLMALFHDLAGSKKHCNSCRKVEKVIDNTREGKAKKNELDTFHNQQKSARQYVNENIDRIEQNSSRFYTKHLVCGHKDFKNVINHCINEDELSVAMNLDKYIPILENGKYEPLKVKGNTAKKITERNVRHYTVYEFNVDGETYILKCEARKRKEDAHVREHPYFLIKKK